MKVSREQMAENRCRILEAASRLFRAKGFEAVSVAEVMKAAGLTHGGFYGHFRSKDELIACALTTACRSTPSIGLDIDSYIKAYLSPRHRDNVAGGCPLAGLSAETLRQTPEARAAITNGLLGQIEHMNTALQEKGLADSRRAAVGSLAAMVGALMLARTSDDPALSDEILEQTRAWIDAANNQSSHT